MNANKDFLDVLKDTVKKLEDKQREKCGKGLKSSLCKQVAKKHTKTPLEKQTKGHSRKFRKEKLQLICKYREMHNLSSNQRNANKIQGAVPICQMSQNFNYYLNNNSQCS